MDETAAPAEQLGRAPRAVAAWAGGAGRYQIQADSLRPIGTLVGSAVDNDAAPRTPAQRVPTI